MAKPGGGTRLKNGSRNWNKSASQYAELVKSGKYRSNSYFSQVGGGYVVEENGTKPHSADEWFVARALADHGRKVIMWDEAGTATTPEGEIISIGLYEQRTPTLSKAQKRGEVPFDKVANIRNALGHARDKHAGVAVIYMKNNLHDVMSVKAGIESFEERSTYRFREIIVITSDGRQHRHKHNK